LKESVTKYIILEIFVLIFFADCLLAISEYLRRHTNPN